MFGFEEEIRSRGHCVEPGHVKVLEPNDFRLQVVEPAIQEFDANPESIMLACAVIWGIDALAAHVGIAARENDQRCESYGDLERNYKKDLVASQQSGVLEYEIIKEVSIALKHGIRGSNSRLAPTSDVLKIENVDGWSWYFAGAEEAPRWGPQVVCRLNLDPAFDKEDRFTWNLGKREFSRCFLRDRPLLGLIEPAMSALGFPSPERHRRIKFEA